MGEVIDGDQVVAPVAYKVLCAVVWSVRATDFAQSNEFLQLSVHSLPEDALSNSSEESFSANVGSLYLME